MIKYSKFYSQKIQKESLNKMEKSLNFENRQNISNLFKIVVFFRIAMI